MAGSAQQPWLERKEREADRPLDRGWPKTASKIKKCHGRGYLIPFGFVLVVISMDVFAICLMVMALLHGFSKKVQGESGGKAKEWNTKLQTIERALFLIKVRLIAAKIQSSLSARHLLALSDKGLPIHWNNN